jgi:hypothetical protein
MFPVGFSQNADRCSIHHMVHLERETPGRFKAALPYQSFLPHGVVQDRIAWRQQWFFLTGSDSAIPSATDRILELDRCGRNEWMNKSLLAYCHSFHGSVFSFRTESYNGDMHCHLMCSYPFLLVLLACDEMPSLEESEATQSASFEWKSSEDFLKRIIKGWGGNGSC